MKEIIEMLNALLSATNTEWKPITLKITLKELEKYNKNDVLFALREMFINSKTRITPAMIFDLLPDPSGFPSISEAWTIAQQMLDESRSIVVCDEVLHSAGIVWNTMRTDRYHAYQAFEEVYKKVVKKSKQEGKSAHWFVSYGTDKSDRSRAEQEAINKNRISITQAKYLQIEKEDKESDPNFLSKEKLERGFKLMEEAFGRGESLLQENIHKIKPKKTFMDDYIESFKHNRKRKRKEETDGDDKSLS